MIVLACIWVGGFLVVAAAMLIDELVRADFMRESATHRWIVMPSYALAWPFWIAYALGVSAYRAIKDRRS